MVLSPLYMLGLRLFLVFFLLQLIPVSIKYNLILAIVIIKFSLISPPILVSFSIFHEIDF